MKFYGGLAVPSRAAHRGVSTTRGPNRTPIAYPTSSSFVCQFIRNSLLTEKLVSSEGRGDLG